MTKTGRYYLIEGNAITDGPRAMVGSWKNTTNLECLSDAELLALGWRPEYEVRPSITAGQKHDSATLDIQSDKVVKTWAIAADIPQEVLMRQARDAIILAGKDEAVEAAIDGIQDVLTRKRARSAWEYSGSVERQNQFVLMLTPVLGGSNAVDALFISAAAL